MLLCLTQSCWPLLLALQIVVASINAWGATVSGKASLIGSSRADPYEGFGSLLMENSMASNHEDTEHWIIVILFLIIISFSLIFESLLHRLKVFLAKQHLNPLKKMVNAICKELTILGFISFTLFSLVHCGFVQKLNDSIFGVSKTEAAAIKEAVEEGRVPMPPTTMQETFEGVHILVFIVMATFILEGSLLLLFGYRVMKYLRFLDEKTEDDLKNDILAGGANVNKRQLDEALLFFGLKRRFLEPNSAALPKPRKKPSGFSQFSFTDYLTATFSEILAELVEIPPSSLAAILVIVALLRPAMDLVGIELISFMIFLSISLLLITGLMLRYVQFWERQITPNTENLRKYILEGDAGASIQNALVAPIDSRPIAQKNFFGRLCNRTQRLIPFGKALYLNRLIQLFLFFHAAYFAVLVKITLSTHSSTHVWWGHGAWAHTLAFLVLGTSLFLWTKLIRKYAMVSSLDFLASQETIRHVEDAIDHDDLAVDTSVLQFILHKAELASRGKQVEVQKVLAQYDKLPTLAKESIERAFRVIVGDKNKNQSAAISHRDCQEFFRATMQGVPDLQKFVDDWFKVLDLAQSGYLDLAEFKALVLLVTRIGVPAEEIPGRNRQQLQKLFDELNVERSDYLTKRHIGDALKGMDPPITDKMIDNILKRMSHNDKTVNSAQLLEWAQNVHARGLLTKSQASPH